MIIQSVKLSNGKMMATIEDGLLTFDMQLPDGAKSIDDVIAAINANAASLRKSAIVAQLQHLAGVELSDRVAVFAALQSEILVPALAVPADPKA